MIMIKKFYTAVLMALMLAVAVPALSVTAAAQKRTNDRYDRYDDRYDDEYYDEEYNGKYKRPNVYDRHRKAVNIGVATAAGAIIGGFLGGKKGALIGAGAGVVTGAIVTKKQKPRNTERYPYQY
jgi:hypothetical protein